MSETKETKTTQTFSSKSSEYRVELEMVCRRWQCVYGRWGNDDKTPWASIAKLITTDEKLVGLHYDLASEYTSTYNRANAWCWKTTFEEKFNEANAAKQMPVDHYVGADTSADDLLRKFETKNKRVRVWQEKDRWRVDIDAPTIDDKRTWPHVERVPISTETKSIGMGPSAYSKYEVTIKDHWCPFDFASGHNPRYGVKKLQLDVPSLFDHRFFEYAYQRFNISVPLSRSTEAQLHEWFEKTLDGFIKLVDEHGFVESS